jgi:hypothetical protein
MWGFFRNLMGRKKRVTETYKSHPYRASESEWANYRRLGPDRVRRDDDDIVTVATNAMMMGMVLNSDNARSEPAPTESNEDIVERTRDADAGGSGDTGGSWDSGPSSSFD